MDRIDAMVAAIKALEKVPKNEQHQGTINQGLYYILWLIAVNAVQVARQMHWLKEDMAEDDRLFRGIRNPKPQFIEELRVRQENAHRAGRMSNMGECNWTQEDVDYDDWDTDCGECFTFFDSGPKANRFKFCPYCGKKLQEVAQPSGKDE